MSNLITIDPHGATYDYKQSEDPTFNPELRVYPKWQVEAVNDLVYRARGADTVKTEKDWNLVAGIVVFFIRCWPEEWEEYRKTLDDIRGSRRSGGYSKDKEMRFVGAMPLRLERLIKACFPDNEFNKNFVNTFVKRFKIFRVGGEGN